MNHHESFIPAPRRVRRDAARRRVGWAGINLATAVAGLVGALGARVVLLSDTSATAETLDAARARLDEVNAELSAVDSELGQIESRLTAHARATVHPDWSILLAYISRVGAGPISLESFILEPGDPDNANTGVFALALAGRATTQNAVTDFVLALEQSGVFSQTDLVRSGRTPEGLFTFAVSCSIGEKQTGAESNEDDSEGSAG